MNSERHARTKEIFLEACELAGSERAAYVANACGGDAVLRAAVDELLANDDQPHPSLAAADEGGAARWLTRSLAEDELAGEPIPERIGAYRVVRLLGRGGMGAVYEAEQENPRRRVALKVIALGPGSSGHLQRFRQEAELLGRLHHPGIAHVYEAGTAEIRGAVLPYLTMELVDGATLLEHARRAQLGLEARLELLVQVCDAVQHAHENGILHRDLKPTNIAVDAAGRAKVLDFGVARLLERAGGQGTTATGVVIGTLATMSPEQVSGSSGALDERSDVYSLGVIAYELLTGRLPLEVSGLALPQAARLICEAEPPLAGEFERRLHGDPETILSKALSKNRAQRYASARELAADIQRYLRREPIVARPASTFYHLRMFARRNRALVAGVLVAAGALVLGAVVTGWFAWRESLLRSRAEREAYRGNVLAAGMALEQYNRPHASALLNEVERLGPGWEFRRLRRGIEPWISAREVSVGHTWQAGLLGDGGRAVVVGQNGAVVVWDVETGERELELGPHPARANPVALSTEAGTVLSVSQDELRFWDLFTGQERARLPAAQLVTDPRNSAALAPDGRHAVVSARDRGLLLVDAASGVVRVVIPRVALAAFGDEGRLLATASPTETAVWSVADGSQLGSFEGVHEARAIAFDAAGTRLAVSGERGVRFFDMSGGRPTLAEGPPEDPTALAFSPDGRRLAGMLDDGTLLIWDEAGRLLERFPVARHCWKTSLAWRADGERLLTAAHTNPVVCIWSLEEGRSREVLRGHSSYVYPVACSPDGRRIVSGGWDDTVRIWNAVTGECLATLESRAGRVHALAIAPHGKVLVAGTGDGDLIAWDARTGAELARSQHSGVRVWECCVKWSPDGRTLAASFDVEGGIRLLEPASLEARAALEDSSPAISTLAFHPRASILAAGNVGGEVVLWDLGTRAILARRKGLPVPRSLCFSPDGTRLAVAGDGAMLALFDAHTLDERKDLVGHAREVFSAVFSPDGSRLFSGGRDGLLRVWKPASGDLLGEFSGHRDYIWSVAVSPDGARVVTGSGDFDVRLWESEPAPLTDRRRREAAALAAWAVPVVGELLAELGQPAAVAERLEGDLALSDARRQAAQDELLRRACAPR